MPDPSLLLLIPAYNEERRIEPVLRDYAQFFGKNYSGKFQLVVVLNGCTDDTLGVVRRVAAEFPVVRALEFKEPIGKGGALIEGLKLAALRRFDRLHGRRRRDAAAGVSGIGAAHWRTRIASSARAGCRIRFIHQAQTGAPAIRQPRCFISSCNCCSG